MQYAHIANILLYTETNRFNGFVYSWRILLMGVPMNNLRNFEDRSVFGKHMARGCMAVLMTYSVDIKFSIRQKLLIAL